MSKNEEDGSKRGKRMCAFGKRAIHQALFDSSLPDCTKNRQQVDGINVINLGYEGIRFSIRRSRDRRAGD